MVIEQNSYGNELVWHKQQVSSTNPSGSVRLEIDFGPIANITDGVYYFYVRTPSPTVSNRIATDMFCHKIYLDIRNGAVTTPADSSTRNSRTRFMSDLEHIVGAPNSFMQEDNTSTPSRCIGIVSNNLKFRAYSGYSFLPGVATSPSGRSSVYNWWDASLNFEFTGLIRESDRSVIVPVASASYEGSQSDDSSFNVYVYGSQQYYRESDSYASCAGTYYTSMSAGSYDYLYIGGESGHPGYELTSGDNEQVPREFLIVARPYGITDSLVLKITMTTKGGYIEVIKQDGVFAGIDTFKLYWTSSWGMSNHWTIYASKSDGTPIDLTGMTSSAFYYLVSWYGGKKFSQPLISMGATNNINSSYTYECDIPYFVDPASLLSQMTSYPSTDGTYNLQLTISNGNKTISWVQQPV